MALTKVTSSLVKDDAVTSAKIVDGGIATADIANNAVTSTKIAQNSILTKHIDDGQVTTDQLGADAVTSAKIADDAISDEHLDITVITSLTEVTAATGDLLMVADISDSNNLKKIPVSSILLGNAATATTAGTVTTAAQSAITSLGTLTTLTVDDITINGSTISDAGDLTLDIGADMIIDVAGGDVRFKGSSGSPSATIGTLSMADDNFTIASSRTNYDIVFKGNDDGSVITALTLDMSDAGKATFNAGATFGDSVNISHGTPVLTLTDTSSSATTTITVDGVNTTIDSNGTNGDIIFKGQDSSSEITALTLDMSDAGSATFNNKVNLGAAGVALLNVTAADGVMDEQYAARFQNNEATAGRNYGVFVAGGSNSSDESFSVRPSTNTSTNYFKVRGDGNVGIGTASPGEKLHVEGSMMLDAYNVGAEEGLFFREGFSSSNKYNMGIMTYAHNGSTNDGITIGAYNGFSVSTGSNARAERFRISSTGKVGIGSSPSNFTAEYLNITTPASGGGQGISFKRLDSNSDQQVGTIRFANNSTDDLSKIVVITDGANTSSRMHLQTNTGSGLIDALVLQSSGYVDMVGAADLRLTLGSQGTAGNNDANWIRGTGSVLMYNSASDDHRWEIGGTENMRLDANPSASVGHLQLKDNFPWIDMIAPDSGTFKAGITARGGSSSTQAQFHLHIARDASYKKISTASDYDTYLTTDTSSNSYGNLIFGTRLVERMRIESEGDIRFGIANAGLTAAEVYTFDNQMKGNTIAIRTQGGTGMYSIDMLNTTGGSCNMVLFRGGGSATTCGTITATGNNAVQYNTSSDYRLKENVNYSWDATTRLKQLKPAQFNWITDETNTPVDGFIAHEVTSIVPQAVSGEKDAVFSAEDETKGMGTAGDPIYQGIDQAKLVPLLVKTVQELEARIKTLEDA